VATAEYMRHVRQTRRSEYFADKMCKECGSREQLELDHIKPIRRPNTKRPGNGWIWTASEEKRKAELKLCQVLCHYCHLKKTKKDLYQFRIRKK